MIVDETCVKADFKQLPGQQFYFAYKRGNVSDKCKTIKVIKFAKKFLVWQRICFCGLKSKTFFTSGTINQEMHIQKCLEKRLSPLIRSHKDSVIFWPDLEMAHYARATLGWYSNNNIEVVLKTVNPPNIEKYWAIVKCKLKKTGRIATNERNFKRMWDATCDTMTNDDVQALM
ncbi:hypothetical protein ILUMI_14554 [Ignelater luminosus]|uniref:Transposase n=1 Tax=Ignelater luminosus TaxID=2038154 RepID=A0A8K0CS85_IGNLU|nr:hypothetical protein ILUMI_14554 [Ignelater luminosus]